MGKKWIEPIIYGFEREVLTLTNLLIYNCYYYYYLGKKRVTDVQFYSEVVEASQHLDHGSRSYDRYRYYCLFWWIAPKFYIGVFVGTV